MKQYFLFIILLIILPSLSSNEPIPYRLVNADDLNMQRTHDDTITHLAGNVHFFYDEIEFLSDRAQIFEQQQIVILIGNVKVIQDTLTITSEEAHYSHITQLLRVERNIVIEQNKDSEIIRRVTANHGNHNRETGDFFLIGLKKQQQIFSYEIVV